MGVLVAIALCHSGRVKAQADELAQLALNIEKLAQFKQILSDLKKGYEILSGGYNTIKNISQGNFKLHQTFLSGLYQISPAVKNYSRIGDIINSQVRIVKMCKSSIRQLQDGGVFSGTELDYVSRVCSNISKKTLGNIEDLAMVLTAGKTRMDDEERMAAIDQIYLDISDKERFLKSFNSNNGLLMMQRKKGLKDISTIRTLGY